MAGGYSNQEQWTGVCDVHWYILWDQWYESYQGTPIKVMETLLSSQIRSNIQKYYAIKPIYLKIKVTRKDESSQHFLSPLEISCL